MYIDMQQIRMAYLLLR